MPALIGQVQDAAALQSVECLDFARESRPLGIGEPGYFVRGKPDHAGRVIDAGGAAQTPLLLRLERAFLRERLGGAHRARPPGTWSAARPGNPSASRARLHAEPGWGLPRACASIPPSPAGRVIRPEGPPASRPRESTACPGSPGRHRRLKRKGTVAAGIRRPGRPGIWENAAAPGEQHPDAFIKAPLAMRHGPIGGALIQKHRAQPDQPRVDDLVHRTRLRRFLFMRDGAGKTRFKQACAAPPGGNPWRDRPARCAKGWWRRRTPARRE